MQYKSSKTKKRFSETYWPMILSGCAFGFILVIFQEALQLTSPSIFEQFVIIYLAYLIQLILHEAGHLLFGLLTGYRFVSFRIGNFHWAKQDGRLRLRKYHLAGTGGQCLMGPPDWQEDHTPYFLYNLGGSLLNFITAILLIPIALQLKQHPIISFTLFTMGCFGILTGLINGIPMQTKMVNNDGYNIRSISKSKTALRSFWLILKINEQISNGVRLKNMPEAWFVSPDDADMKNSMNAKIGVLAANRIMDEHAFDDAAEWMEKMLQSDFAIEGIQRIFLTCDLAYCALIRGASLEQVDALLHAKQRKFMKSMKSSITVLRTQYAYALLAEGNPEMAEKYRQAFEKCASAYPYVGEVDSERALMAIAAQAA